MKRTAFVVVAILASSSLAAAQETGDETPAYLKKSVTFSMSPIHLIFPFVEGEVEFKPTPHVGVGLILGSGKIHDEANTISASAYELGGQINYYMLSPFSGLHIGAEAIYMHADNVMQDVTLAGEGTSFGGYVGYKVQTALGFAFIAQGGVQYLAVKAHSSTAMAEGAKIAGLLNLNVGWSF
jgi:hypothetical protein